MSTQYVLGEKRERMSGNSTSSLTTLSKIGLGYGIAIAVGIVVLITTIMLASYVCVRVHGQSQIHQSGNGRAEAMTGIRIAPIRPDDSSSAASAVVVPGLDQATLDSYPKFKYVESEEKEKGCEESCLSVCSICLSEYREAELLRMLPDCGHVFHADCIDSWMRLHATCPMCRSSPLPSPLSTPLSELVPLALHIS